MRSGIRAVEAACPQEDASGNAIPSKKDAVGGWNERNDVAKRCGVPICCLSRRQHFSCKEKRTRLLSRQDEHPSSLLYPMSGSYTTTTLRILLASLFIFCHLPCSASAARDDEEIRGLSKGSVASNASRRSIRTTGSSRTPSKKKATARDMFRALGIRAGGEASTSSSWEQEDRVPSPTSGPAVGSGVGREGSSGGNASGPGQGSEITSRTALLHRVSTDPFFQDVEKPSQSGKSGFWSIASDPSFDRASVMGSGAEGAAISKGGGGRMRRSRPAALDPHLLAEKLSTTTTLQLGAEPVEIPVDNLFQSSCPALREVQVRKRSKAAVGGGSRSGSKTKSSTQSHLWQHRTHGVESNTGEFVNSPKNGLTPMSHAKQHPPQGWASGVDASGLSSWEKQKFPQIQCTAPSTQASCLRRRGDGFGSEPNAAASGSSSRMIMKESEVADGPHGAAHAQTRNQQATSSCSTSSSCPSLRQPSRRRPLIRSSSSTVNTSALLGQGTHGVEDGSSRGVGVPRRGGGASACGGKIYHRDDEAEAELARSVLGVRSSASSFFEEASSSDMHRTMTKGQPQHLSASMGKSSSRPRSRTAGHHLLGSSTGSNWGSAPGDHMRSSTFADSEGNASSSEHFSMSSFSRAAGTAGDREHSDLPVDPRGTRAPNPAAEYSSGSTTRRTSTGSEHQHPDSRVVRTPPLVPPRAVTPSTARTGTPPTPLSSGRTVASTIGSDHFRNNIGSDESPKIRSDHFRNEFRGGQQPIFGGGALGGVPNAREFKNDGGRGTSADFPSSHTLYDLRGISTAANATSSMSKGLSSGSGPDSRYSVRGLVESSSRGGLSTTAFPSFATFASTASSSSFAPPSVAGGLSRPPSGPGKKRTKGLATSISAPTLSVAEIVEESGRGAEQDAKTANYTESPLPGSTSSPVLCQDETTGMTLDELLDSRTKMSIQDFRRLHLGES
ncbi:unnamed protein product [Amoebophrya sp. A25]|nr:unnamed protein product [Amoebophrya sp. A25]|eukprot:GSA25T00008791001.1